MYCIEVKCPESGWMVPLLPTLIVSASKFIVVTLDPCENEKCYKITVRHCKNKDEMERFSIGTLRGNEMVHSPDGVTLYRTKIRTIRGDYKNGTENKNRLRMWKKSDFIPRPG